MGDVDLDDLAADAPRRRRRRYRLTKLEINRNDLVTAGANQHSQVVLFKSAMPEGIPQSAQGADPDLEGGDTMPETDQLAELAKSVEEAVAKATGPLTDQITALTAERDELLAKADATDPVEKALAELPEPVRKRLEAAEADAQAAREAIAKMEDERLTERYHAVAQGFAKVARAAAPGGNAVAELGEALKAIAKLDTDALDAVLRALAAGQERATAADEAAEIGSAGARPEGQATATVMAKANELKAADPTLHTSVAITKAVDVLNLTSPEVVRDYLKEQADA